MVTRHTEVGETMAASELDTMLSSEPKIATLTRQQLFSERVNDLELLQELPDFPVKLRAQPRASIMRSLTTSAIELKTKKCPACSE